VIFLGWSPDEVGILVYGETRPTMATDVTVSGANVTLYAVWGYDNEQPTQPKDYYITATVDSGSSISPSGIVMVSQGENMAFTFFAKPGYRIVAVYVDGVKISATDLASGRYVFTNVISNHMIKVVSEADNGDGTNIGGGNDGDTNGGDENYSVLNIIVAVLATLMGVIAIIAGRNRFKDDEAKRSNVAQTLRILALFVGIVSVIVFFLTEDITLSMTAVDEWTPLMVVLLIAAVILAAASFRLDESREDKF